MTPNTTAAAKSRAPRATLRGPVADEARRRILAGPNPLAGLTAAQVAAARRSELPEVLGVGPRRG